ncbi:prominin-1-A-like isoform X2 [Tubulanus polymorphus]|uniref:prominin-1-A-like isoform X2 n=1 Tax=Tubulanus polymorphus TaxID=672921 RepID=UPI003DA44C0B
MKVFYRSSCSSSRRTILSPLVFIVFLLLCCWTVESSSSTGDDGKDKEENKEKQQSGAISSYKETPLEEGMEYYYFLVNGFLGVVQPKNEIINFTKISNIPVTNITLNTVKEFSFWKPYLLLYVGYLVCFIFGILFVVLMPIIGFCFCCCRCCGKCGGRTDLQDPKNAKCKRGFLGFFFFLFTMLMLAATVCAFLTNDLLRQQTSKGDQNFIHHLNTSINGLEDYLDRTGSEIETMIAGEFDKKATQLINTLEDFGMNVQDEMGRNISVTSALEQATSLANSVATVTTSLTTIKDSKIKDEVNTLKSNLSTIKTDVENAVTGCSTPSCESVKTELTKLDTIGIDTTQFPNVNSFYNKIKSVNDADIKQYITEAQTSFDRISKKINQTIQDQINTAKTKVDEAKLKISDEMAKLKKQISGYKTQMEAPRQMLSDAQGDVETYGNYRTYACIGIACILGVIVFFNLFGLLYGACGERPYEDAGCCNKGIGANMLMAAVGFTFIFGWILMLFTSILFIVGGMMHTEICRHMAPPDFTGIQQLEDQFGYLLKENLKISFDISQSIQNCRENQAIYRALDLKQFVDVKQVIDSNIQTIYAEIDRVVNETESNVDVSGIDVIPAQLQTQLDDLINAETEYNRISGKIDTSLTEFNKNLLTIDIASFTNTLEQLKAENPAGISMGDLDNAITGLKAINLTPIEQEIEQLKTALQDIKDSNLWTHANNLKTTLTEANAEINTNFKNILKEGASKAGTSTKNIVTSYVNNVLTSINDTIGRCLPLYNTLKEVSEVVCQRILHPLNGFWFSLGWFLFISIFSVICGIKLVGLYRKTEKYIEKGEEYQIDDNYQGIYPGDNIPLEKVTSTRAGCYHLYNR